MVTSLIHIIALTKLPLVLHSRENYKKRGGSRDGSREMVKMDPSNMWAVIGKQENRGNGMAVQIYLVNSMKNLLIPLNDADFKFLGE